MNSLKFLILSLGACTAINQAEKQGLDVPANADPTVSPGTGPDIAEQDATDEQGLSVPVNEEQHGDDIAEPNASGVILQQCFIIIVTIVAFAVAVLFTLKRVKARELYTLIISSLGSQFLCSITGYLIGTSVYSILLLCNVLSTEDAEKWPEMSQEDKGGAIGIWGATSLSLFGTWIMIPYHSEKFDGTEKSVFWKRTFPIFILGGGCGFVVVYYWNRLPHAADWKDAFISLFWSLLLQLLVVIFATPTSWIGLDEHEDCESHFDIGSNEFVDDCRQGLKCKPSEEDRNNWRKWKKQWREWYKDQANQTKPVKKSFPGQCDAPKARKE